MVGKSDYTYEFIELKGKHILVLYDQNLGNMSLTNNMENVLLEIEAATDKSLENYHIIYRDSEGTFDEVSKKGNVVRFHPIGEKNLEKALGRLVTKM